MSIYRVLPLTILCLTMSPDLTHGFTIAPGTVVPVVMEVTPDRIAPYEIVTITGFGLGRSMVRDVYLTDSKGYYRGEILEQTDRLLRFRVPGKTPPGRKRLALEVPPGPDQATDRPKLVDQDFYVDVDPVQLRDVPLSYPGLPTDFKKKASYQLAGVPARRSC